MKKLIETITILFFLFSFSTISLGESYVMHTVDNGDTYWNLSKAYNQNMDHLFTINNVSNPNLKIGDFIKIKSLNKNINIFVDGTKIVPDSSPYLENNRTFVPIRFIAEALAADVQWDASTRTAIIKNGNKTILLPIGSQTASINGSNQYLDAPIKLFNDRVYVPLRFISENLDTDVSWNQESYSVNIATNGTVNTLLSSNSYSQDDIYWLSRIVNAESKGESYTGKLAVANVILNRVKSNEYPNTIKGVIFDNQFGYQFTPAKTGTIYDSPSNESIKAAKEALEGHNNIGNSLFFVNHQKSQSTWIQSNRTYYSKIGDHTFYL